MSIKASIRKSKMHSSWGGGPCPVRFHVQEGSIMGNGHMITSRGQDGEQTRLKTLPSRDCIVGR